VAALLGDYNADNRVDTADYVVWRRYMGTNTVLPNDATPGSVGQDDFLTWKANYGNESPGAGGGGGAVAPVVDAGASSGASTAGSGATQTSLTSSSLSTTPARAVGTPTASYLARLAAAAASASQSPPSSAATPPVTSTGSSSPITTVEVPNVVTLPGVSAAPAISISPLLAAFGVDTTFVSIVSPGSLTQSGGASSGAGQSFADLLLLDEALAELDADASGDAHDDDAPFCDRRSSDDENADDLALAAVFDDESNWWSV
jgi:hypothetical protein